MQNHNTQLSHYTQICKQCLSEYKKKTKPKLCMSALHSVTHPKMNPTDILRGSTLPVASTPLQGKEDYPVFNWQLSQRPLCLQLPSPCSKRHTVFNHLPKMGFRDILAQHSSQCLWCVTIIWGWSTNTHNQHSPEKSQQHNQVSSWPKSGGIEKLTRLVHLVWFSGQEGSSNFKEALKYFKALLQKRDADSMLFLYYCVFIEA